MIRNNFVKSIKQIIKNFHSTKITTNNFNNNDNKRLELTLAIIKPHICNDPSCLQEIRSIIVKNKFLLIKSAQIHLTRVQAELFYEEHRGKFFYERLVTLMTSGELSVHILAKINAIQEWRKLMGPTKVFKTRLEQPNTIRGIFGLTDTRNATHGSDSTETAHREIELFFPKFSIQNWFEYEEFEWRTKNDFILDKKQWIHRMKNEKC
ncbi:Nucleoside diphosphate kinase 6 [Dermatophagoides pteronyssinus]|uniref:Nucleoside diphosphate kinase 6-like n=2 Tax=Dermatophagoides pteronyssinus TaxID=6956 RepID=A0A6P6XW73_DERPT|nr:nucleoside diphosphate kinase 6-like [Dermatophagoides pteronyssinus]KAH9422182.1 Nucleoside diphosphate kinase 6 [Dermatophagoides pteronyssinus]